MLKLRRSFAKSCGVFISEFQNLRRSFRTEFQKKKERKKEAKKERKKKEKRKRCVGFRVWFLGFGGFRVWQEKNAVRE
jgi:hypothetical protein